VLIYAIPEAETVKSIASAGADACRLCSETYARAIAFATRYWAGEAKPGDVRFFSNLRLLSAEIVHFDGGDPGRELFVPRKFYGQSLEAFGDAPQLSSLFAKTRIQFLTLPEGFNPSISFLAETFGKKLKMMLPGVAQAGNIVQIDLTDNIVSASVYATLDGQFLLLGSVTVEEVL